MYYCNYQFAGNNIDERRFQCMGCGKRYKHRESLSRHKHACGNVKKFCCPYCPHGTNRNDKLKLHIYSRHRDKDGMQ